MCILIVVELPRVLYGQAVLEGVATDARAVETGSNKTNGLAAKHSLNL